MIGTNRIDILLVEDNAGDQRLFQLALEEVDSFQHELSIADTLETALSMLESRSYDIIVADLSLPDSSGISTSRKIMEACPDVPVIVLSGNSPSGVAHDLLTAGVQDFLEKEEVAPPVLRRAIRYAIDRHAMWRRIISLREKEQGDRLDGAMSRIAESDQATVTAAAFGIQPLNESLPDAFEAIRESYADMLEKALEQRIFKVDNAVSSALRSIADNLGFLRATPRDVITLHRQVLDTKCKGISKQKAKAYIDEGRLLVLELMGYLVLYYRKIGIRN